MGNRSGGGTGKGGSQSIREKQTKVLLGWKKKAHGGVRSVEENWELDILTVDLN